MKHALTIPRLCLAIAAGSLPVSAQLVVPSDGSDGDLNVTLASDPREIDLNLAVPGVWSDNNAANAGRGIYDKDKWAVVFKYNNVRISGRKNPTGALQGVQVIFANHASNAPLVWLVKGDCTIDGILNLSGRALDQNQNIGHVHQAPGPGGFRSGFFNETGRNPGFGPGADVSVNNQAQGRYASGQLEYGNSQIIPLIGGSGGASGGGGGAILIAVQGKLTINGFIISYGGIPGLNQTPGGFIQWAGSGGAIRIIANELFGQGRIEAVPDGRIRLEVNKLDPQIGVNPQVGVISPPNQPVLWPADNASSVRIASVDGKVLTNDIKAQFTTQSDVNLDKQGDVVIVVETRNFPPDGQVDVRVGPSLGAAQWRRAQWENGDRAVSTWKLSAPLASGFTALQARARFQ